MMKLKQEIKKQHKLFMICISIVVSVAMLIVGSTFAWLIDSDQAVNDMHLADLEGVVVDTESADITVNDSVTPDVKVENTSKSPVFIRVLILPVCETADKISREMEFTGDHKELDITFDSNWAYSERDGYCYYKGKIIPGEKSSKIFESLTLISTDTIYSGENWKIEFKAEFIGVTGHAYRDAWWQGVEQTEAPLAEIDNLLSGLIQK